MGKVFGINAGESEKGGWLVGQSVCPLSLCHEEKRNSASEAPSEAQPKKTRQLSGGPSSVEASMDETLPEGAVLSTYAIPRIRGRCPSPLGRWTLFPGGAV